MGATSVENAKELVFLPLGGVGEIGMNVYLYGYGEPWARQWLMVDLGITFAGDREPGVDVILPDIRFIEEERDNLIGILLTHAHEDHYGAIIDLWPRLRAPIYATPFTMALLKAKFRENGIDGEFPIEMVMPGSRFQIGPFDIELVTMTHSIPEPNAVAIRTSLGLAFHSGDWKLDTNPVLGDPTDTKRIQELGEEGVATLICDSTNVLTDGESPSESEVAATLAKLIDEAERCVAVTTFASNVSRIRAVADGAAAAGRHLVVVGRAMHRVIQAAKETGFLAEDMEILSEDEFGHLPGDKVVALCTGSQGESRAALARIASDNHPNVSFSRGDRVIFSSRTIPGNEKAVAYLQNKLVDLGVELMTDSDALVHTSGHPRRGELEKLYGWLKPQSVIPMHGEIRHLESHVALAKSLGVSNAVSARNGSIVRLLPGPAEIIDEAPSGRQFRDGLLVVDSDDRSIRARRKLSVAGMIVVSLVLSRKGELVSEPLITMEGIPNLDEFGDQIYDLVLDTINGTLESIPRARRKDDALVSEAVRRSVRAAIKQVWGKRPICSVLVSLI
ncbi:ribonuclease J [bacterium MnTg02]|nr:ribonuclease J [bacterium MnTg02]